jgi:hypothetical protein
MKTKVITSLKQSGRSVDYLQDEFPDLFETESAETDEEIWWTSPEIRDFLMDGLP